MRIVFFFCLIFFTLSQDAFAQGAPQIRRLPPSLERELKLRKGGKIRIIGFTDTLKAQSLIAQSIRDSASEELDSLSVKDSAIIVIDSSVSLTDKKWLDSMLAELPEYRMTPEGIRFHYPADILVETSRKTVPSDTTLASRMDPVSKEDLPLYDALPIPRPLQRTSLPGTSVELGAGAPYLPRIDIRSLIISNEQTSLDIIGKYRLANAPEPAIKQFWQIGALGNFAFPNTSPSGAEQIPQLTLDAVTGANKRLVVSQIDSAPHTLSQTNLDADFTIGTPSQLKMRSHASLSLISDDIGNGNHENKGSIDLSLLKDISNSSYRLQLDARYQEAGLISLYTYNPRFIETQLFLQQKENDPIQWRAGVSYLGGSDASGSTSVFFPVINIRTRLSHSIEIGAGFEPKPQFIGLRELLMTNLFYSPVIAGYSNPNDGLFATDKRRIVTEPIHLNAFFNYFLSLNNEWHAEFRFIERNNEPVFQEHLDIKGHPFFDLDPENTRRIEVEAGESLLLFTKDNLRASLLFRSAVSRDGNQAVLPYEPKVQIQAVYQFRNISEKFIPQIELVDLERPNHALTFINLDARYIFNPKFQLKFRAENIFGSAGDFWTGYNEYPRAVWVGAQYSF